MAESVESELKSRLRAATVNERLQRRQELFDKHRNLKETFKNVYTEKDVADAARALAHGDTESKQDAFTVLKASFLQGTKLIVSYLKIEGALHSLIGFILGKDPYMQLLAMECCCNLSLGDGTTCFKLAKAATPYLITVLHGCNYPLMDVALQTLNNLSKSGEKTCQLLHSQGILDVYRKTIGTSELTEMTAKAFIMIFKYLKTITFTEASGIFLAALPFFHHHSNVQWVFFILSTMMETHLMMVDKEIHLDSLKILNEIDSINPSNLMTVTALIRLIGNLSSNVKVASIVLDNISLILNVTKKIKKSNYNFLLKEMAWVIGSIVQREHRGDRLAKLNPLLDEFQGHFDSFKL